MELTNEQIIAMYEQQDILNANFKKNKQYAFDLDVQSFALRVRNLKTQIYGLVFQSYFATLLDFKITPSSLDCGDFSTKGGHDIEFKCSFIDNQSQNINIKNIRNWQNLDFYYVFTVDYRDYRNILFKCYELSKQAMIEECILMNAKPMSNVKAKNDDGENRALGFRIKENTEHYKRWEDKYLNRKIDIAQLSINRLIQIKKEEEKQLIINIQALMIQELEQKLKQLEAKPKFELNYNYIDIKVEEITIINDKLDIFYILEDGSNNKHFKNALNISTLIGAVFSSSKNSILKKLTSEHINKDVCGTDFKALKSLLKGIIDNEQEKQLNSFIKEYC